MADDLEYEYAGFWIRVVAAIIDTVLALAILIPLAIHLYGWEALYAMGQLGIPQDDSGIAPVPVVSGWVNFLINFSPAIAVIVFWIYKSSTPGKMIVGAKIVDATTGANLTVGQSIGRYLAYYVSIIPLFLGLIWVAIDPRKQGWHDKLAHTVVIRTRRAAKFVAQPHVEHRPGP
jgi:uncharacterized RDD family membrane protein YckC